MGWTVLYIAFGVVALWLLGEVLLQYKARLRWRLLAFGGFLGVVLGVLLPSVVVIVLGAVAFAVGQTYVTLSFRRGFSTGWALGGRPGASRRRRSRPSADRTGPTLEVTDLSYEPADSADPADSAAAEEGLAAAETTAVYEPQPIPEDTGQYAVYGTSYEQQPQYADPYATGYEQQPAYDYGAEAQQQYAAYSDPYIGQQYADAGQQYADPGQQYGVYQQPYADPYAPSYTYDTPPGGIWVPQQRDTDQQHPDPHQHQHQQPYGYGEDQQYRY